MISVIKQGAVFPDKNQAWSKGRLHPWWHGRWQTVGETVWRDESNKSELKEKKMTSFIQDVNYCAVLETISDIAFEGGTIKAYMEYDDAAGMDIHTYREIVYDIKHLNCNNILSSNTKANRKYFLYGCAIHSITDAFAHSTTNANGVRISHNGTPQSADEPNYYSGRYKMATYTAGYILKGVKNNEILIDGKAVLQGIKRKYEGGDANFKMIKIKPYLNINGYNAAVLDKLNINAPTG